MPGKTTLAVEVTHLSKNGFWLQLGDEELLLPFSDFPWFRKRVQRLMRLMGLAGMAPGPNTSRRHPTHKVDPYLLRGVAVVRPKQVWSTDSTCLRLPRGFAYLVAVIEWYSRKVLSWRISNRMEAVFCVDCLEECSSVIDFNSQVHRYS